MSEGDEDDFVYKGVCAMIEGAKYDPSDDGPCHYGCKTCAICACPWASEYHFDDGSCGQCDYEAVYCNHNYLSQSERLEAMLEWYVKNNDKS